MRWLAAERRPWREIGAGASAASAG